MSAMHGISSRSGEMPIVHCMSIPAASGAVYLMISIKKRWEKFFEMTTGSLDSGKEFDQAAFGKWISNWEWQWVNKRTDYPLEPVGNSIDESIRLYRKYNNEIKSGMPTN